MKKLLTVIVLMFSFAGVSHANSVQDCVSDNGLKALYESLRNNEVVKEQYGYKMMRVTYMNAIGTKTEDGFQWCASRLTLKNEDTGQILESAVLYTVSNYRGMITADIDFVAYPR